jgi:murein DD-endopeptidase MepM/ murein hydrolase activator NlpD
LKLQEWWAKLHSKPVTDVIKHKHRFVVMDTDTFKEKFSFQLSGINIFVTVGITVIVFILVTTIVIAFTPLREWIPGYTDSRTIEQTFANARRVDSLEALVDDQQWMLNAIRATISGEELGDDVQAVADDTNASLQDFAAAYRRSREDSLLRDEVEREDSKYEVKEPPSNGQHPTAGGEKWKAESQKWKAESEKWKALYESTQKELATAASQPSNPTTTQPSNPQPQQPSTPQLSILNSQFSTLNSHLLFPPLKGKIINHYDPATRHLGIDIAGSLNQAVYAVYSGTVVFANFTAEQGHVIAIQHPGNVITVYRNNSTLLKRQGDMVRAGEPIGYVGNSSLNERGPHLHFELWSGGSPVNPEEYISF